MNFGTDQKFVQNIVLLAFNFHNDQQGATHVVAKRSQIV